MTLASIKDFVESIIEDIFSDSYFISKMNEIRDEIDGERDFEFSTTSQTFSPTGSYTTGHALPTDFETDIKVVQPASLVEFRKVKIEDLATNSQSPFIYAINYDTNMIYFGGGANGSVTLYYNKRETDFSATTETPNYPTRFHRVFAYKFISDYYLGEDIDEVNRAKGAFYKNKYDNMLALMKNQDAWRKCNATGSNVVVSRDQLIANGILPIE